MLVHLHQRFEDVLLALGNYLELLLGLLCQFDWLHDFFGGRFFGHDRLPLLKLLQLSAFRLWNIDLR